MKFKPGNLITHVPTNSVWIIVEATPHKPIHKGSYRWSSEVEAFCVYAGDDKGRGNSYWEPGLMDTWLLTKEDVDPLDKIWRVETVV